MGSEALVRKVTVYKQSSFSNARPSYREARRGPAQLSRPICLPDSLHSGDSYSGGGTSEYSTGLRATERVSRELTTALGILAARATVGVLG